MTIYDRNFGLVAGHRSPIYNTSGQETYWNILIENTVPIQHTISLEWMAIFHASIL